MGILYFIVQFIITTSIFVFTYVEVKENYKTSKKKKKLGFVLITISFLAFGATIIDFFIKNLQEQELINQTQERYETQLNRSDSILSIQSQAIYLQNTIRDSLAKSSGIAITKMKNDVIYFNSLLSKANKMNIELQNSNIFINEINKSLSDSLNVIIAKSSKQYEKLSNLAVSLESMKMPINQAVIEITVVNHLSDSQ